MRRAADPDDARAVRVHLTDDGLTRLEAMRAARTALLERRLADFTADERAALAAALPLLDRLMEEDE